MTWYSNKLLAASGLEGNRITGFSNIMPFSYPRLIVLKAEEIAWYSNKPDRWFCAKVVLKTEEIARFSNKWRCKSVNEDVLKGGKLQGLKRVKNEISGMRWNYRSTQTKREYWLSMVGLAVKSFWEKKLHGTQRFSNLYTGQRYRPPDLEEDRITGYSNTHSGVTLGRRFGRR